MTKGEEILNDARKESANNRSAIFSVHKIETKVWYDARKEIRNTPRKMIPSLLDSIPVPMLSSVISAAGEAVVGIALGKSRKSKLTHARQWKADWPDEPEAVRKLAKFEAKDLTTLADDIDRNMVKLKDACRASDKAVGALQSKTTDEAIAAGAHALAETEHYVTKLGLRVAAARKALDAIEGYLDRVQDDHNKTLSVVLEIINEFYDDKGHTPGKLPGTPPPLPPLPPLPPRPGVRPPPPPPLPFGKPR